MSWSPALASEAWAGQGRVTTGHTLIDDPGPGSHWWRPGPGDYYLRPDLGLIQPITPGPDLAAVIRGTRAIQADTIYSQYKPQVLYNAVESVDRILHG